MANVSKIVFIGAGSMSFGLSTFRDMFFDDPVRGLTRDELHGCTLTLVDTNPEALARMAALAEKMNADAGSHLTIEQTTDRRAALDGAGFVINSVAIDRTRLWKQDFAVPKRLGIRHTLGENGGPGGLFFTLRTLPLIFDIIRDMEELCPNALFLNYSNPESRIVLALAKYSKIKAVGLCHGIFMARGDICRIIDREWRDLELWAMGLNHFQVVTQVRERATGRDLYPLLKEKAKTHDPSFMPLTRRLMDAFGHWLTCSDDHLGEYLPYGWEGGEDGYDFAADEEERAELKEGLDAVLRGEPLPEDWEGAVGERTTDVIGGVLHNRHRYIESAVLYNNGAIPNLPADLAVEVPAMIDLAGVHPISQGPLPEPLAKLLTLQAAPQQLAVEAAMRGSKELALQALLVDPVINSSTAAVKLLDELWEINRPYIRSCL
jgi:alpha-galactosidase